MTETISILEEDPAGGRARADRAKAAFLIHLVSMATGVPPKPIAELTRAKNEASRARWLAIYLMHTSLAVPLARIAAVFGRDRTTVSLAIHRVEDWRSDPQFDFLISQMERCAAAAPLEPAPEALGVHGRFEQGGQT